MTISHFQFPKSFKDLKGLWFSLWRRPRDAWVFVMVLLGVVAALLWFVKGNDWAGSGRDTSWARGPMVAFTFADKRLVVPESPFFDEEGTELSLADFRGRVVLVNLWATWCAPCLEEMPRLDLLQEHMASGEFQVVAISVDKAGLEKSRQFLDDLGVEHLDLYSDPRMKLNFTLSVYGLPTTLLLDREGREIGRLTGTADWDGPYVRKFLQNFIDEE